MEYKEEDENGNFIEYEDGPQAAPADDWGEGGWPDSDTNQAQQELSVKDQIQNQYTEAECTR